MKTYLSAHDDTLKHISDRYMHCCWYGGLGDGRKNRWKSIYLTNDYFINHTDELPDFESSLAASNILMVHCYRWSGIVLAHIRRRYIALNRYEKPLHVKLNDILKERTCYENVQALFEEGM